MGAGQIPDCGISEARAFADVTTWTQTLSSRDACRPQTFPSLCPNACLLSHAWSKTCAPAAVEELWCHIVGRAAGVRHRQVAAVGVLEPGSRAGGWRSDQPLAGGARGGAHTYIFHPASRQGRLGNALPGGASRASAPADAKVPNLGAAVAVQQHVLGLSRRGRCCNRGRARVHLPPNGLRGCTRARIGGLGSGWLGGLSDDFGQVLQMSLLSAASRLPPPQRCPCVCCRILHSHPSLSPSLATLLLA